MQTELYSNVAETRATKKSVSVKSFTFKDEPGTFKYISKHLLLVDPSYQRSNLSQAKINAIAKSWSWVAAGSLIVADRLGTYYVIDGQHRLVGAKMRSDVDELPCMVFKTEINVTEAEGFIKSNTLRKPITGVNRFNALLVTQNPAALLVKRLCDETGRAVRCNNDGRSLRCAAAALELAGLFPAEYERIFLLLHALQPNDPINEKLLRALVYVERHMVEGSLTDKFWTERLHKVGFKNLTDGIQKAASFYISGGAKIYAQGVVRAMNFNHRRHLVLDNDDTKDPENVKVKTNE